MKWVVTRTQLSDALLEFSEDRSFSVAFIGSDPTADDILAVRQAARLCDIVVVAVLGNHLHERYRTYLEGAGADITYIESTYQLKGTSQLLVNGTFDATFYLKTLLKVLPLVATISTARFHDVQALKALEKEYEGLFTLITQDMAPETMTARQRKVRTALSKVHYALQGGEVEVHVLRTLAEKALRAEGVMGQVSHTFVQDDLSTVGTRIQGAGHYFVTITTPDEILRDSLKFGSVKKAGSTLEKSGRYI